MPRLLSCCFLLASILAAVGCGQRRPDWMEAPPVNPSGLAKAVMAQADADTSGKLDAAELASIPSLRDSLEVLDTDGDLQLSKAEIHAWFERVKKEDIAYDDALLVVTYKGKPAADVLVKIVPEACMGGTIQPAEGRTDSEGRVALNMPTSRLPGVRCGLYRLEITGKRPNGKPIPKQYNTETTLGLAVGGGLPQPMTPEIAID